MHNPVPVEPQPFGYVPPSQSDVHTVWHPPRPEPANRFAIASMICGIIGFYGLGCLLGIAFGVTALVQIKRRPQRGRGLAVGGVVVSVVTLLVWGGYIWSLVAADARDQAAGITRYEVSQLEPGHCVLSLGDSSEVDRLPVVDCAKPHEAEIYHVFLLPAGPYPGEKAIEAESDKRCAEVLEPYITWDTTDLGYTFLYPPKANWNDGDRKAACIAAYPNGTTTTTSLLD